MMFSNFSNSIIQCFSFYSLEFHSSDSKNSFSRSSSTGSDPGFMEIHRVVMKNKTKQKNKTKHTQTPPKTCVCVYIYRVIQLPFKNNLDFLGCIFHENSMNFHEPRVGTGTTGPGEAVFAIRFDGKPIFFRKKWKNKIQKFENELLFSTIFYFICLFLFNSFIGLIVLPLEPGSGPSNFSELRH